jgi:hypothetical protein
MGNTALVNKNAALNIVCWQCEHFNPSRDPAGAPPRAPLRAGVGGSPAPTAYCNGECRKNPPFLHYEMLQAGVLAFDATGYFPFVPLGNTAWCSGFQRAVVPLPAPVIDGATNCTDLDPTLWATPNLINALGVAQYRRVPAENSCWYCQHFQTQTGGAGPQAQSCVGWCQKDPPKFFVTGIPGGAPPPLDQQEHFPLIDYAYYKWCSKWERSILPVPAPPAFNGVPCAPPV